MQSLDTDDRPLVLVWELTQACELACDHCRADARPERHPDELTTAEGRRLLEDARSFGEGQLLVLSGGDPLVREDVTELVRYGTELGLRVTITPSGTRSLTRERIAALADAGIARLALSLDGATAAAHDAFRGESGSFEETIEAAAAARGVGVPLQINTTVCRETVEELPGIRALLSELGAAMWSVFFLVPVGRGRLLESLGPAEAEAVMEWLHAVGEAEPFGLKTTEAPHYRRVAIRNGRATEGDGHAAEGTDGGPGPVTEGTGGGPGPRRRGIVAGDGFAFVSHTGEVFPSGFLPKSAGNVRERPVTEIYRNADPFTGLRDRDRLTGKCGACPYRRICGGSRSRAYATAGDPFASDPLCPYVPAGYEGPLPWDEPPAD